MRGLHRASLNRLSVLLTVVVLFSSFLLPLSLASASTNAPSSNASAASSAAAIQANPSRFAGAATSTTGGYQGAAHPEAPLSVSAAAAATSRILGAEMGALAGRVSYSPPLDSSSGPASQARIWTDKSDYPPGSVVTIYGSGFASDANVALALTQPNGTISRWSVESDYTGTFTTSFQIGSGSTYHVTATDGTNTASTSFTDSGPIAYIPITITNSAPGATPNPLQVSLTFDPATYTAEEKSDLGNIRFCADANCATQLDAWLESCASPATCTSGSSSALAWVKLTSTIAGSGGTLTIYMAFFATTTEFDANFWGEAPQLSATYGQYDNGANVFTAYFNGNTATSSFSVYSGYTLTQATGVTGPGGTTINAIDVTGYNGANPVFSFNTAMSNAALITESSFSSPGCGGSGQTDTGVVGLVNNAAAASVMNAVSANCGYGNFYFNQDYESGGTVTVDQNQAGTATASWLYATLTYTGSAASSWSAYIAPQLYSSTGGYSGTVSNNPLSSATHLYLGQVSDTSSSHVLAAYYNFDRARAYPPSGVMPGAVLGTLTPAVSGVTLGSIATSPTDVSQPDSVSVSWTDGATPFVVTLYYSASSSACSSANTQAAQLTGVASSPQTLTFTAPDSTGTYYYCATVTDAHSNTASSSASGTSLVVHSALTAPSAPTLSAASIDVNQAETVSGTIPSTGSSPYSWQWLVQVNGAGGYSASTVCSANSGTGAIANAAETCSISPSALTAGDTYNFELKVTDKAGATTTSTASATLTVHSALAAGSISPSGPAIDTGQSMTLTANPSGGTGSYTYRWYSGSSATCSSDTTALGSASTQSVSPTVNTYYCYKVTDSASAPESLTSATDLVTVDSALAAGPITPSGPTIDSGQSVVLTANPSGGTAPYAYQWYSGASSTCSSDTTLLGIASTQSVSPASNAYYCYKVTDSSAGTPNGATSSTDFVTVEPALSAGAVTPSNPTIDSGQSVTLTSHPSGGTGSYTYHWYSGSSATCASDTTALGTASAQSVSPGSNTYYCYSVADTSTNPPTVSSSTDLVTVNPALAAGAITPSGPTIDSGQSVTLTANPSGGTPSLSYLWYTGAACTSVIPGQTGSTYIASPTTTATYYYKVTDSAYLPVSQCSAGDTVTVDSALLAGAITPSAPTIDNGNSIILTANPSGGAGSYAYQWYSGPSATCSADTTALGTASTQSVSPASATYYCYSLTDTSTNAPTVFSSTDLVAVNPPLAAGAITPSSPTIDSGQSITLTANPSAGTPPYYYLWYTGAACTSAISGQTGSTYTASPTTTTTYYYQVTGSTYVPEVRCSAGDTVTVDSTLSAGAITPSAPSIDVGQSVTLTANPSGGSGSDVYQWYTGAACTAAISGQTGSTYLASPSSTTTYFYMVTDSVSGSACSSGDLVTVNTALAAGAITPSAPTIDSGQSIALTSHASGGTPSLSYLWYTGAACTNPISGQTGSTIIASPTSTTTYYYKVTDSAYLPVSQCSAGDTVTVNPVLTVSVAQSTIDSGQTATLTASASGGSGTYSSYAWYQTGCTGVVLGTSASYTTASLTSTTTYCVVVTDSLGGTAQATVQVTVNSPIVAPIISASPSTIDNGQSSTLSTMSSFSGGTSPYTCVWLEEAPGASTYSSLGSSFGCAAGGKPTVSTGALSTSGTWHFELQVKDGVSSQATSAPTVVTVNIVLTVLVSTSAIDSGQTAALTAAPSGGSGIYPSYAWYLTTCTGTVLGTFASYTTASLTSTTTYCVLVTDSLGGTAQATGTVTVNPVLTAPIISASVATVDNGQSSTLSTATPFSGGTSPYVCQWLEEAPGASSYSDLGSSFASGCTTSSSPTASTGALTTSGTWHFELQVTDSSSTQATATSNIVTVTVNTVLTVLVSPSTIDTGQTATLIASPSGGSGTYSSYAWYQTSCTGTVLGTSASYATPSLTSTTSYCILVSDSLGGTATTTATITVRPALTVPIISASPSTIDNGQSSTLSTMSSFSGGTSPYICQWLEEAPGASSYSSLGGSFSCAAGGTPTASTGALTTSGTWHFELQVEDNSDTPVTVTSSAVTVTVNPALTAGAIAPSSPTIDSGQSITLTANPSGGTAPYTYQWYSGSSASCASDVTALETTSTQLVSPTSNAYYCYTVTDSSASPPTVSSPTDLITVNAALSAGAITPSAPTIDSGQSVTLTSHASGGTAPLSYLWYTGAACTAVIPGQTGSTYIASPTSTTTYYYKVTDATSATSCSSGDTVTVGTALFAGAITPSGPTIDTGQTLTLTAAASGGTGTYTYQWYSGSNALCSLDITTLDTASAQLVSPTSNTYYCYTVTDISAGVPNGATSSTDLVTVNPALAAGAITPSAPTIDSGQSVALTANPSGGTPTYSYLWYTGASCTSVISGQTGSTYIASPTSTTTYYYKVTDSAYLPTSQCSTGDTVTVDSTLTAGAITPSSPTIDNGQSITLTASASGGTGSYTYQWYYGSSATCSSDGTALGTASTQLVSPTASTYYCYSVTDTSANAPTVFSSTDLVTVNSQFAGTVVTIAPSAAIDSGQSITLTVTWAGAGTSPYSVQLQTSSSSSCSSPTNSGSPRTGVAGTSAAFTISPTVTVYYCALVSDGASTPESSSTASAALITVNPALSAGGVTPSSPTIDSGQSITLTANPSGGTTPYSYLWYMGAACTSVISGQTGSTYIASPASTATYSYEVTDSASSPASLCSAGDTVTVDLALSAGGVTPSSPTIDSGQSITLTANPSGGTTPYSYLWYSGSNATCSLDTIMPGTASTQSVSPAVSTYYCYVVTDSSTGTPPASATSSTDQVTVGTSALSAGAITPSSPTIDNGQSITLTANPSGGTAPYTLQWYFDGTCTSIILGQTGSTYIAAPASTATYSYEVTDSASSPASLCSAGDTVAVNSQFTGAPSIAPSAAIDSGQSITLTVTWAGAGTSPYSVQLQTSSSSSCSSPTNSGSRQMGIAGTSTTFTVAPAATVYYCALVSDGASTPESSSTASAALITVNPALSAGGVTPSSPTIDSGQSITLTASASGGTGSYTYQWYYGSSATCSSDGTALGTASTQLVSPTASTYYCYSVTDSASTPESPMSATDLVTVNPPLAAFLITLSTPTIDSGQSVTVTSHASGGTPSLSYLWYTEASCTSAIPGQTGSTYIASPASTTTYYYKVTDSAYLPASQCSAGATVTVDTTLTAGAITPTGPTIDGGQSITLTANPSGGSGSNTYQWYADGTCTTIISGQTGSTYLASPSSTTTYSYMVTDSLSGSACSSGDIVTVNPLLAAGAISPSAPTIDSGQSVPLTANPSGGTAPYGYQWYTGAACTSAIPGQTGSTYIASPTSTTTYYYKVTDSAYVPVSQCSTGDTVTVGAALTAGAITPSAPSIDIGQPITLDASPSGGFGTLSYQWYYGSSATCSSDGTALGTASTQLVSPTASTYYCYSVTDASTGAPTVFSSTDLVTVNPVLAAGAITPSAPTIDSGESVTLTSDASGGTPSLSYLWYTGAACTSIIPGQTGSTYIASPTTTTTYYYQVTDSAYLPVSQCSTGDTVTANTALTVSVPPSTIDSGQTATLTASPSGGSGTYSSYAWYLTSCNGTVLGTLASYTTGALTSTTGYCVFVTDSAGGTATTTVTITVNPAIIVPIITVSPSTVDSGQPFIFTITGAFTGGTPPYTCQPLEEFPGSSTYTDPGPAFTCNAGGMRSESGTLSVTGVYSFELQVTDSSATPAIVTSPAVQVTVNVALTVSVPPSTIDSGQTATLTASPSGGSGTYSSYAWYQTTCTGTVLATSASYTTPSLTSTTSYCVLIIDSIGGTAQATATVTVNPVLVALLLLGSPTAVDIGQPALFSNPDSSFTGGTAPYTCQALAEVPGSSTFVNLGPSFTCSPGPISGYESLGISGVWYFEFKVTDSSDTPVTVTSDSVPVTVNPAMTVSVPPSTIDSGQTATLTASPSGGSGTYSSYAWYLTSCTGTVLGTSASYTTTTLTSTASYCVYITDSVGGDATTTATVTVNGPLIVNPVTVSPTTIDSGQSAIFSNPNSSFSGGTAPYTCQVLGEAPGASSFSDFGAPFACAPGPISGLETVTGTGIWSFELQVTDSSATPVTLASNPVTVIVNPALTVSVPPFTIDSGQTATLTASPSGGSGTYSSYAWYLTSCTGAILGTSASYTTTALTSTTSYCVFVTDSIGGTTEATVAVTVNAALTAPIISASPTVDNGESSTLSTTTPFTGGTSTYACQWLEEAPGASSYSDLGVPFACTPSDAPTLLTGGLSIAGTWHFELQVTDSATIPTTVTSAATITVSGPSTLAVTISPPTIDTGQTATLTASPSGGSGTYSSYAWYLTSCTGAVLGTLVSYTTAALTSTTGYCVLVTDSVGNTAEGIVVVTVNTALTAGSAPAVSATTINASQAVTVTGIIPSTGTSLYSWTWLVSVDGGGYSTAAQCAVDSGSDAIAGDVETCTISGGVLTPGDTYAFELSVTDSAPTHETTHSPTSSAVSVLVAIAPSISLSSSSGHVGSAVTVTGSGFAHSSHITITYDGVTLSTDPETSPSIITTSSSGGFTLTFTVPSSVAGAHTVRASDGTNSASASFTVTPTITLVSPAGSAGTTVTLTGTGFAGSSGIAAAWNGSPLTLTGTATTDGTGAFSVTFTVPSTSTTANTVSVTDSALDTASAQFSVPEGEGTGGGGIGGGGEEVTSTSASFTCPSTAVTVGTFLTCTFTVTSSAGAPTGTVGFSSNPQSGALGLQSSCSLVATSGISAGCSIAIGPSPGSAYASYTLTGSYGGDSTHAATSRGLALAVQDPTSTTIGCSPSAVPVGSSTICTVTVKDTVTPSFTPTAFVLLSGPSSLGANADSSCTLVSGMCSITLTPSSAGTFTVNAEYIGDSSHAWSQGSASTTAGTVTTTTTTTTTTTNSASTSTTTTSSSSSTTTSTSTSATSTTSESQTTTTTVTSTSTLAMTIIPTSGPSGTVVSLTGSGLNASTTYSYCFESGITLASLTGCPAGSATFTTDSSGNIPAGITLTATGQSGLFVVSNLATGAVAEAAQFTITASASHANPTIARLFLAALLSVGFLGFILAWRSRVRSRTRDRLVGGTPIR